MEMKEYLVPGKGGFRIVVQDASLPIARDWTWIPDGADCAIETDGGLEFYRDNLNLFFSISSSRWKNTISSRESLLQDIVWRRPTKPEALPFIDDNPQSLNDQYAEIEQVRQNGLKFDNGKPRHSLLPKGSIGSIIAVLEFGAKKYEANNWQKVDNAKERYYDAAMRHIDSWWNGEKFDQETGIHHLAHAATNLFFLKWFDDKENNNG